MKIDLHATSTVIAILGVIITIMTGAMWMGELSNSVMYLKSTSVSGERIARIEARLEMLVISQERTSRAVDELTLSLGKDRDRRR